MQVLTHLILNDMIKVKGQISEMATCIVDHDERISNLAKLFFHELSRKVQHIIGDNILLGETFQDFEAGFPQKVSLKMLN